MSQPALTERVPGLPRPLSLRGLSLLSPPVAFPLVWLIGVVLAQIHVLDFQSSWSATTWLVMAAVPIAFVCGAALASAGVGTLSPRAAEAVSRPRLSSRLRRLLIGCVAIGLLEVVYQCAASGTVPLLSGSIDAARVGQVKGPSILLLEPMLAAVAVCIALPERLSPRSARFELGICAAGLFGFALQAGRAALILPVAAGLLARFMYWGIPRPRYLLLAGVALVAAISAVFFVRTAQEPSQSFQAEFYNRVVPDTPAYALPLLPVDLAIATNYQALAALVDHFPAEEPYGHGKYDARALDRFVHGTRSVGDVSATLTPPWLTSTAAGPLWADGGLPWVVVGLALIGLMSTAAYQYFRRTNEFHIALVAGYLLFLALFAVYDNLFTEYVNWLIDIPLLLVLGAVAMDPVSPPGITGRLDRSATRLRSAAGRANAKMRGRLSTPAATAIVAGVVILALVLIGSQIKKDSPTGGLQVSSTLSVRGPQPGPGVRLATDGDLPSDNLPLWWADPRGSALHELSTTGRGGSARQIRQVPFSPLARSESFDVSTWGDRGVPAVFRMRNSPGGVSVEATRPGSSSSIAGGTADLPPATPGATRDLEIATWTGTRPDLLVVDRGLDDQRVSIRIFSGESGFRRKVLDARAPIAGLSPGEWSVDVANAVGPTSRVDERPDLVLLRRDGDSGLPEVHVLTGESDFQDFGLERQIALPEELEAKSRFAVGATRGTPTIYALEPRPGEPAKLRLIMLGAPVSAI